MKNTCAYCKTPPMYKATVRKPPHVEVEIKWCAAHHDRAQRDLARIRTKHEAPA